MNLALIFLVLALACRAEDVKSSRRGAEDARAEKRTLAEGNQALEKRTTVLSTVTPSVTPRIEYANTKELPREQSPAQQVYVSSTPVPQLQIAKISDVLTGQGPPFHAAIASHLYSPISVYQARLSSPTIYEVSQPIASHLAYSEKLPLQPQYTQQAFGQRIQKPERLPVQPPQQYLVQPAYQQQQQAIPQQVYQFPQVPQTPVRYQQQNQITLIPQAVFPQNQVQHVYKQIVPAIPQNVQPGIVYVKEETSEREDQRSLQELKEGRPASKEKVQVDQQLQIQFQPQPQEIQIKPKLQQIQIQPQSQQIQLQPQVQQIYNGQPQGAISYASFSQSQPAPSYQPQYQPQNLQHRPEYQIRAPQQFQNQQQQIQNQHQQFQNQQQQIQNQNQHNLNQQQQIRNHQYQEQQQQFQAQQQHIQNLYNLRNPQIYQVLSPSHLQAQPQILPQQLQIQYQEAKNHYQNLGQQSQTQYQSQLNAQPLIYKLEPVQANSVTVPVKSSSTFLRPVQLQPAPFQPQALQSQVYSGALTGPELISNPGYGTLAIAPTFPSVQYFGKFAQAIFGAYPHKK